MITRRRLPAVLLAWVLVVASASTAIWFVIERAGSAVSTTSAAMGQISAAAPSTAGPGPSTTPSGRPVTTPGTGSGSATDTWTGSAGQVTATCRAGLVTLNTVLPADGYRVEGRSGNGTTALRIDFDGPRELNLTVTCAADGPQFRVQGGD